MTSQFKTSQFITSQFKRHTLERQKLERHNLEEEEKETFITLKMTVNKFKRLEHLNSPAHSSLMNHSCKILFN